MADHSIDTPLLGFDSLRLACAILVLVSHSFVLTAGSELAEPLYRMSEGRLTLGYLAVGSFFSMSGYLIAKSATRSTGLVFWEKRARRILPALLINVLLCGLFLGPLLSEQSIVSYFTDSSLWRFLATATFLSSSFSLPGVFADRPYANVINGSLWSLRYEVLCYLICVMLVTRRSLQAYATILLLLICLPLGPYVRSLSLSGPGYHIGMLIDLFRYFGAGMLMAFWDRKIPVRWDLGLLASFLLVAGMIWPSAESFIPIALSYALVVYGRLGGKKSSRLLKGNDLSYGTYLWAFPIQQLVIPVTENLSAAWFFNISLALPMTLICAYLSWHFVEKPALRRSTLVRKNEKVLKAAPEAI